MGRPAAAAKHGGGARIVPGLPNWAVYWAVLAAVFAAAWAAFPCTVTASYLVSCSLLAGWRGRKGDTADFQPAARAGGGDKLDATGSSSSSSSSSSIGGGSRWLSERLPPWARGRRAQSVALSVVNCLTADALLTALVRRLNPPLLRSFDGWWPGLAWAAWIYVSPLALLLFHDAWFYATHRALHAVPFLYRHVHAVHHERAAPEAWDLFWMHPLESVVTVALPFCVTPRLLPLHWFIWEGLVVKGVLIDCYGHCGFDAAPFHPFKITQFSLWPGFPWRRVFLTAKHHDDHHRCRTGNYGLYLDLWDKALGTEAAPA